MLHPPGRAFRPARSLAAFAVLSILLLSSLPLRSSAEIPHENYDIANPDLEIVINLLNASIRASEQALMDFYNQSMQSADQYLDLVNRVLGPADQILGSIQDVADSYQNLSYMLPPFKDLYAEMTSFSSMETTFLSDREQLVAASHLLNLTDAQRIAALEIIRSVKTLMNNMNATIDQMLVSADQITTMTVGSRVPFAPNQLEPLILKLRELMHNLTLDIEGIIYHGVPWGEDTAFLVLWISDDELYLGESLVGGGYLFYNGSFRGGDIIHLFLDSRILMNLTTSSDPSTPGSFRFSYEIPMNASMLGHHVVFATAHTTYINLASEQIGFDIVLMPTSLSIHVDKTLMSINETVTATLTLKDVYGRAIDGARVNWSMDLARTEDVTDASGRIMRFWSADDLGFGEHLLSASYVGQLPYASTSTPVVSITVNIPTHIEIELFSATFAPGYFIVGNGSLAANESDRLAGQAITILLDGTVVLNATTDESGEFAFSISSEGLAGGTHTLKAQFLHRDVKWRYSDAEVDFTIGKYRHSKYPFLPFFPGWQTGPSLQIPYLFFGPYAYYTWLFMLLILGVIVKTFQIRRSRVEEEAKSPLAVTPLADANIPGPGPEVPFSVETLEAMLPSGGPSDPNGKIVWYYHGLLDFLRKKRRVGIEASMTHWEVARLLNALGYSKEGVERVTLLFEKAFYSGRVLAEDDAVGMSSALSKLIVPKGGATVAG